MLMRIAAFLFALAMSGLAAAQSWPSRPVRMIVPFPAGGPTDVLTRALAEKLSAALVEVCNLPETKQRFAQLGAVNTCGGGAALGKVITEDSQRWAKVIKQGGIKVD